MLARVALLAVALMAVCVDSAAADGSAPAVSGRIVLTSDPDDPIGKGRRLSFPARAIELGTDASGAVDIRIDAAGYWRIGMSAPDGAHLERGVYPNAQRSADAVRPGLDVSGDGAGCGAGRGDFEVLGVEYGPHDYLQSLRATFEHHCHGLAPALRGEIDVAVAPPPPALELELTLDEQGARFDPATATISLRGTVECSESAGALVSASASEAKPTGAAVGGKDLSLPCSPDPTAWVLDVSSYNGIPFTSDDLEVTLKAQAVDEWYSDYTGEQIVASDSVPDADEDSGVDVEAISPGKPGFLSREPVWSIAIALAILGAVAWALVAAGWLRGRGSGPGPT
jgi:hypothetical protein